MTNNSVCVAELKSAYGIKGWLWLYSNTDPMTAVFDYQPLFYTKDSQKFPLLVEKWRKQGKGLVVKLKDVDDRTTADTFVNTKIWLQKENLPSLNEGEFYWSDLVNMTVVNEENKCLGRVKQLFETNAHQIMEVVATSESEDSEKRLIPWHDTTILNVDVEKKVVLVAWQLDY